MLRSACLLEAERTKTRCNGKYPEPAVNRYVDTVRSRITNNEARKRAGTCDAPEAHPHASHVAEIGRNHRVVSFLSTVQFSFYSEFLHTSVISARIG